VTRRPLVAGNWKMNLTPSEGTDLVRKLLAATPEDVTEHAEMALLPPFTHIAGVRAVVAAERPEVVVGAQDLSPHDAGAYTGDVSGPMLSALGCRYVVVGHSERREHHGEDDELVSGKVRAALRHGLVPILCIGEGLGVREEGRHVEYTTGQLDADLAGLTDEQVGGVVVAYEPVWAIGTGRVATPADSQEVCGAVRARLRERFGDGTAEAVRVLYGGSVKSGNVAELVAGPDVDGALVGGASLDPDEFAALATSVARSVGW
jgi:triosephosphate isomerase